MIQVILSNTTMFVYLQEILKVTLLLEDKLLFIYLAN